MKKVLCISTKERQVKGWSDQFKVGRVYPVIEKNPTLLLRVYKKDYNLDWFVDKECFIDMKLVWSAVVFFFVLLFAMTGESIVDYILKMLFDL